MLMKRSLYVFAMLTLVALLAFGIACTKKDDAADSGGAPADTANAYKPTGNEGTITGKVAFTGTPAEAKKIDMSADPVCAQKNPSGTTEDVKVKDGKLEDVFVYIKDGQTADGKKIGDLTFTPPTEAVVLDQNGCHYKPHVLGVMTGQKLSVKNSDPTTHNVHPSPKSNPEWNQSQTSGAPDIVKTFSRAETLIPVKCNQHPWMKAQIGVLKHPYFAVSKEDGTFTLKGVPAGSYTVVAWHEKFGEKTMQVKVDAKGSATADFSYDGAAAVTATKQRGSLEVLPALDLPMLMQH